MGEELGRGIVDAGNWDITLLFMVYPARFTASILSKLHYRKQAKGILATSIP